MASYFNLPFGVRVSNEDPLDGDRYIASDIATRDLLITNGRAYVGLQVYVDPSLYILKTLSPAIWSVLSDASITGDYLKNTTDTFIGVLTLDGSLVITGNIIQDGSVYETHAEQIYTKDDYIVMREGALTTLADGSISGFKVIKADGTHNVLLGTANDGIMRVGWEDDTLQALATREDSPNDNEYAYWDDSSTMFKTNDLKGYIDGSIVTAIGEVDTSLVTYVNGKVTNIDTSLNGIWTELDNIDSDTDTSFGLYETKVNLDSSFGDVYTEIDTKADLTYVDTSLNAKASTSHASTHISGAADPIPNATTSNSGLLLTLNNSSTQYLNGQGSWATPTGGITSVAAGSGMDFTTITGSGPVTMGTPSDISTNSTNLAGGKTHSHNLNIPAKDFTTTEVTNLRGAKLDDGTTPWTAKLNNITDTLTGVLTVNNPADVASVQLNIKNESTGTSAGAGMVVKSYNNLIEMRSYGENHTVLPSLNLIYTNTTGGKIRIGSLAENGVLFEEGGPLKLYWDGDQKLQTSSTGITVTGVISATSGNSTQWNTAYGWGDWSSGVNQAFVNALNVDADTLDAHDTAYFLAASGFTQTTVNALNITATSCSGNAATATDITGILGVGSGGTGLGTIYAGGILIGHVTGNVSATSKLTFDETTLKITGDVEIGNSKSLSVDGSIFATNYVTATDFILSSDRRLKDNIKPITDGLDTALKFEPITHTWKNKGDKKHVGFIAQDVEKICNTLVSEDPDGFKGISYSKVTVINNAAIHELYKKIEILEEKVRKLEK